MNKTITKAITITKSKEHITKYKDNEHEQRTITPNKNKDNNNY